MSTFTRTGDEQPLGDVLRSQLKSVHESCAEEIARRLFDELRAGIKQNPPKTTATAILGACTGTFRDHLESLLKKEKLDVSFISDCNCYTDNGGCKCAKKPEVVWRVHVLL